MSVKAYILANVEAGLGEDVIEALSAIEGVKSAHNVTGPYDVIGLRRGPRYRCAGGAGHHQDATDRGHRLHPHLRGYMNSERLFRQ